MNVPSLEESYGAEGVLVAIIDDSFDIHHEAFEELNYLARTKISRSGLTSIVNNIGIEANLDHQNYYLNKKIPYYYDYGGTINSSSEEIIEDDD